MNVTGEVYVAIYARKLRKVQVRIFNAVKTVKARRYPVSVRKLLRTSLF